jgi:hypothetical protein
MCVYAGWVKNEWVFAGKWKPEAIYTAVRSMYLFLGGCQVFGARAGEFLAIGHGRRYYVVAREILTADLRPQVMRRANNNLANLIHASTDFRAGNEVRLVHIPAHWS